MATARSTTSSRIRMENQMIRKREREFKHDQMWGGQQKYYEKWEKQNAKFDEWTSPRYHETNNKLIEKIKKDREKEEELEKRRDKLRKLLQDEDKLYQIEVMMYKTRSSPFFGAPPQSDVSTEILKEVKAGLKVEEDDRRRHEAELKLYHQWRNSNPVLKNHERRYRCRDLKLSWLDQQIENRMRKEQEEEDCRKMLRERDARLKEEERKEVEARKEAESKREELQRSLRAQIDDLKAKSAVDEELKKIESDAARMKDELERLEEQRLAEFRRRVDREHALYNVKQHKLKLKKRAEVVEQNLEVEKQLVEKLKALDVVEKMEDDAKKAEVREVLDEFCGLAEEQKRLEEYRKRRLDFIFDSEAKALYEQQDELWKREEAARLGLIKEVFDTVRRQVDANLRKNIDQQRKVIEEREQILERIEAYNKELEQMKVDEARKKVERRRELDDEVKIKKLVKTQERNLELRRIDDELERARREEERLKKEILELQRKRGPIRPARSRIFL